MLFRSDNRMIVNVGPWSHSVTDHTQGNWNGMVGGIELFATSPVWIDDVQVYPNARRNTVLVEVRIGNATGNAGHGTLTVDRQSQAVVWDQQGGVASAYLVLGDKAKTWDEFNPVLQKLTVRLKGAQADDQTKVTYGLREIGAQPKQFILNGHPAFFRGTLECCIFPLTGFPPTDVPSWKRIIGICKEIGRAHV